MSPMSPMSPMSLMSLMSLMNLMSLMRSSADVAAGDLDEPPQGAAAGHRDEIAR